jgi:uncharacterized repeat protein (TIGR04042 family)
MPEMHFTVRWPDGQEHTCYSPSLVVQDFLSVGQRYSLPDFLARTHEALTIASDRVAAKYGFACSRAMDQWAAIALHAETYRAHPDPQVDVLRFDA